MDVTPLLKSLDHARICVAFNPKCQTIEEAQDPVEVVGFADANIRGPNRLPARVNRGPLRSLLLPGKNVAGDTRCDYAGMG